MIWSDLARERERERFPLETSDRNLFVSPQESDAESPSQLNTKSPSPLYKCFKIIAQGLKMYWRWCCYCYSKICSLVQVWNEAKRGRMRIIRRGEGRCFAHEESTQTMMISSSSKIRASQRGIHVEGTRQGSPYSRHPRTALLAGQPWAAWHGNPAKNDPNNRAWPLPRDRHKSSAPFCIDYNHLHAHCEFKTTDLNIMMHTYIERWLSRVASRWKSPPWPNSCPFECCHFCLFCLVSFKWTHLVTLSDAFPDIFPVSRQWMYVFGMTFWAKWLLRYAGKMNLIRGLRSSILYYLDKLKLEFRAQEQCEEGLSKRTQR